MSNAATAIAKRNQLNRTAQGRFVPGVSGNPTGEAGRARRALNRDTILEMHRAFNEGGRDAILKVMHTQPAVFLKLLVLLVPRELEVTHSAGVKGMSDEAIEAAIEAIQDMLAKRAAGENAKVVEAVTDSATREPGATEAPSERPAIRRKASRRVSQGLAKDEQPPE